MSTGSRLRPEGGNETVQDGDGVAASSPPVAPIGPAPPEAPHAAVPRADQNGSVGLGRVIWMVVVIALAVTDVVLFADAYYGYAGVTLAVVLSAAINLIPDPPD
jgi:hypothetical protein